MSLGSTNGGRIIQAREALILFLRSLTPGCKFTVMSFGSQCDSLEIGGESIIECNE